MSDTISRKRHFPRNAFTLAEVIGAIFLLAIAAAVCVAIVANRTTRHDRTAAMSGAPAAIDALSYYFDNKADVAVTNAAITSGNAELVVCRRQEPAGSCWQILNKAEFTSMDGVTGPVYLAKLTNPKLYENSRAVEFDVTLGWMPPGPATEGAADIMTGLAHASELCTYRAIILRQ